MENSYYIFKDDITGQERDFIDGLIKIYNETTYLGWDAKIKYEIDKYQITYQRTREESFQLLKSLFSSPLSKKDAIHASLLGFCYHYGVGTKPNKELALNYYKIAGDLKDGFALAQFGTHQKKRKYSPTNKAYYLKNAAATGHPHGVFNFSFYQSKREMSLIVRKLAEKDYLPAIYRYVRALHSGNDCNRDLHQALRYAVRFHRVSSIEGEEYNFTFIFRLPRKFFY
ncbi:1824_t:CDS:1 [Ambispora leptoticha]|uniref:1824_t:CDS:1 n=1 Tax=Ambispora leptoticha TaxID=144679 RepID=A0A9N9H1W7_9GLOM|nr:1824_t:CDS:1 [Ambispora leptoticha]